VPGWDARGFAGAADDPSRHRMIRRGIPFRPPVDVTAEDRQQRGLHFFGVVADIGRQFEFVQRNWLSDPNFPLGTPGSRYQSLRSARPRPAGLAWIRRIPDTPRALDCRTTILAHTYPDGLLLE